MVKREKLSRVVNFSNFNDTRNYLRHSRFIRKLVFLEGKYSNGLPFGWEEISKDGQKVCLKEERKMEKRKRKAKDE